MSKDTISVNMNVYDIPILVEELEKVNKEIEQLKSKLQQKDNIIKEVREHIKQRIEEVKEEELNWVEMKVEDYIEEQNKILKILDKGSEVK